ncbi:heat shock protein 26 [Drosophila sulfurigaster albostrigata]|uniref:heat shock protein 26 n=1 Tax=Drosophila sulfurigaster albostrigata TaxID=89887 RepID=UPI002D21AE0B|nr:heat shock protein 26 [Drosophila sulfurigaster albostrigata]
MSMSHMLSLMDALQGTRQPVYDFGMGMHPRQLQSWSTTPSLLMNPWQCAHPACPTSPANNKMMMGNRQKRDMLKQSNGAGDAWNMPMSQVGKDGFQVCMDVTQFSPNELTVKVVNNSIMVEGKHEEREDDHGYISRHFVRRYSLPEGYEADKVMSSLSSDGVLTVNVPKPHAIQDKSKARHIQIQQVGPAHLNVKSNTAETKPEEKLTNGTK